MRLRARKLLLLMPGLLLLLVVIATIGAAPPEQLGWERELAVCRRLATKYEAAAEVRLSDGSRVDLLTQHEAIEVDWAKKWPEAIGQSLYYASQTQRAPAIILLLRSERDRRFVRRCQIVCDRVGIRLYVEPAQRCQEPTLAPEPLEYVPTNPCFFGASGPAAHRPGELVAWRDKSEIRVGIITAVQRRDAEWWYTIVSARGGVTRLPERVLIAVGGQVAMISVRLVARIVKPIGPGTPPAC